MTDAVGSIETSNADSAADAVETEAVTQNETQAPAPSQAEIAAQAAAIAAASAAAAAVEAEAVVAEETVTAKKADKKADKKDEDEDEDVEAEAEEDASVESLAEVEAIIEMAEAAAVQDDMDDDDGTLSPVLAVGLTALAIGGGLLLLSSGDDDDDLPDVDINIPPTAIDQAISVDEDATVDGQLDANDPDSTNLTFSLTGDAPAGFTLNADGSFTIDASDDAYQDLNTGETLDLVVNFQVSDGVALTNGVLTITINGVTDNLPPVLVVGAGDADTDEDTDVIIDPLAGATDADGDVLTITAASSPDGTVVINDDGTLTFTPADDFNGDAVISFTVSDGINDVDGTATVTVAAVDDAPVAADAAISQDEDTVVMADLNALVTEVDGDDVTFALAMGSTLPDGFTVNADGTWTFDTTGAAYQGLAAGEEFTFSFDYVVTDTTDAGLSDTGTITGTVVGVNDAPVAADDALAANTAEATVLDVLANDTDIDGDDLTITAATVDNGTVVINDDGTLTFTSADGFEGDATISYTVSDGNGGTADATAVVTVTDGPPTIDLDLDDDDDPNTLNTIDTDLTGGPFNLVDDTSVANLVQITGFGDDDVLTIIVDDPNDVAFSSGDFDSDGVADDIQIVANVDGVVSEIILIDANDGLNIIFNEATAEAAIGADFENFVFEAPAAAVAPAEDLGIVIDQSLMIG